MTAIEWTDETWNPVTGCTKVSQGCHFCYAERIWGRVYPERPFTRVLTHPERLDKPSSWRKPRRVFVNSMSDLFHEAVPYEFIEDVYRSMVMTPRHTFQILTKRPERMRQIVPIIRRNIAEDWHGYHAPNAPTWDHVWHGVSVENQATADDRIYALIQTPGKTRFVSYEPALGPVRLPYLGHIEWVIAGGESGPKARPAHPAWFRAVRDQCIASGVPFFFKQWGEWGPDRTAEMSRIGRRAAGRELDGRTWDEYPKT